MRLFLKARQSFERRCESLKKLKFDWKEIDPKNFIVLVIAGIINAFGVTIFLFPVKLYDSGISGLSMLLDQITPDSLSLSLFLIILNIPVFLFGLQQTGCHIYRVLISQLRSIR